MSEKQTHVSPPGYVLLATTREGVCGAFTLLSHSGASVRRDGQSLTLDATVVTSLLFAWYSRVIAAKNWQPCDQPTPAAYLPLRYNAMERTESALGILLVQKEAMFEASRSLRAVVDDGQRLCAEFAVDRQLQLQRTIASLLAHVGATEPGAFSAMIMQRATRQSIHSAA